MAELTVSIPGSLKSALDAEVRRAGGTVSSVVAKALAQHLDVSVHTLFQVSTSGALVAGVYDGEVNVKSILDHGDFGLGTFANLDGEMVILDGNVYQVQGTGRVSAATRRWGSLCGRDAVRAGHRYPDAACEKFQRIGSKVRPVPKVREHILRGSA
jgi:acetolactate decarboxylase